MPDILDDLIDLKKQATTERSHYYVASCCDRAIAEIIRLRTAILEKAITASAELPIEPLK